MQNLYCTFGVKCIDFKDFFVNVKSFFVKRDDYQLFKLIQLLFIIFRIPKGIRTSSTNPSTKIDWTPRLRKYSNHNSLSNCFQKLIIEIYKCIFNPKINLHLKLSLQQFQFSTTISYLCCVREKNVSFVFRYQPQFFRWNSITLTPGLFSYFSAFSGEKISFLEVMLFIWFATWINI